MDILDILYFYLAVGLLWAPGAYIGQKKYYPESSKGRIIFAVIVNILAWPICILILQNPNGKVERFFHWLFDKLKL